MTTHAPLPLATGAVASPPDARPTETMEAAAAELTLDALPLLHHRTRERTIAPSHALRGHYLAFEDGGETRLLPIDSDITHIGRGADSEVRFEQHHVSRDHAILVRHGRYFRVLDNRSSNGTFLNGRRIVATNITDGDVIRVGPVAMTYIEVQ